MGVFQPSGGRPLRFEARHQSAALPGRYPPLLAWYFLRHGKVHSVSRWEVRPARQAAGGRDLRTGEQGERGRSPSGGGSSATDLGCTDGDRDAGVLTRIEKLEENGDRSGLVEIEDDIFYLTILESFC